MSNINLIIRDDNGNLPTQLMYESAEEFCSRAFGGREFTCNKCNSTKIQWPGVCDDCNARMNQNEEISRGPKTESERLESAGVPAAYREWTWKGCIVPEGENIGRVRAWDGEPAILSIVGPTGTGKTGLALCLLRDWLLNGSNVKWLYMPDWLDEMRYLEGEGGSFSAVQAIAQFPGLLVFDELATRRLTDYGIDRVLQVLDARTREGLPTIITSNLPIRGGNGIDQIDERIASRLDGGRVLTWTGKDQRRSR